MKTTAKNFTPEQRKDKLLKTIHRLRSNATWLFAQQQANSWYQLSNACEGKLQEDGQSIFENPKQVREYLNKEYDRISAIDAEVLFAPKLEVAIPEPVEDRKLLSPEDIYKVTEQTCILFPGQMRAVQDMLWKILERGDTANLLQGLTGAGKTFVYLTAIRYLTNCGYIDKLAKINNCIAPTKIIIVTKASIVEQTREVAKKYFGFDAHDFFHPKCFLYVTNIDQIRSTFGGHLIQRQTKFVGGEPTEVLTCRPFLMPVLMLWDECQVLKNESSQQATCHHAINEFAASVVGLDGKRKQDLPKLVQIFSSATPFQRVADSKYFVLAAMPEYDGYTVTPIKWNDFAASVAAPSEPLDYNPAAVERLMSTLFKYVTAIKGERWQFKALNSVKLINFRNDVEKATYLKAWEDYQKECALLDKNTPDSRFAILAMFQKFRQAAELIRAPFIAREAFEQVNLHGKAFIGACEFKATIARIVFILINEYGVSREQISLIWGGMVKKKPDEATTKKLLARLNNFRKILADSGMSEERIDEFENQFKLKHNLIDDDDLASDLYAKYGMQAQSKDQREEEKLRFQRGDALYAFFTYKAGGAGLSLHHSDEWTKEKVRRKKESNYAYVEDIPSIPTRPRVTVLTPVYSGIEMIQGLGRGPRLTSLSNTEQCILFYAGTIEEEVAATCRMKLKCISKTTALREDWHDIIDANMRSSEPVVELEDEGGNEIDSDNMEVL